MTISTYPSEQGQLFPLHKVGNHPGLSNKERWWKFHLINRHVYSAIVAEARKAHENDYKVGMKAIFEHLRWQWREQTKGDEYKLNNTYTAYYARLVMMREPDLEGFFETREANSC